MRPLVLPPNQFHRFYRGGARIDALRGVPQGEDGRPEDWVGSTATSWGSDTEGSAGSRTAPSSRTPSRPTPRRSSAPTTSRAYGADPAFLVKLLDAGERLPVHYHPGRPFAREHLGLRYGKTESWLILEADAGAAVHVGLKEPLDAATARRWVDEQDADAMLAALHEVPVQAGDAVLVPAGTLHAIGGGILLLELQEPTDLSVLVEWKTFGVDNGPEHLELGWETALESLDHEPIDPAALTQPTGGGMLPKEADPYFRARRVRGGDDARPVVLDRARDRAAKAPSGTCPSSAGARCSCPTGPATTARRAIWPPSAVSRPTRTPERRPGERPATAGSPQDREVVR